jgi:hypothetical protein
MKGKRPPMLVAEVSPSVEEAPGIIDADATLTLPQHPLVPTEALSLWESARSLLDSPNIRRIEVWAAPEYMSHSTTVGFLLHLGELGRKAGKVVRVRTAADPAAR